MKLTLLHGTHPDEDVFENYAFDRLSDDAAADFEEHLLICENCQNTLAQTDEHIQLMKAATAAYISERDKRSFTRARSRDSGLHWNVAAAAVILLTCLTTLLSWRTSLGEPQVVPLNSVRGASESARARSGQPLDLEIDLRDVRPAAGYRVEVVDATGRRVWFGGTPARLTAGLPQGVYWVRLSTDTGELLREYSLKVDAVK